MNKIALSVLALAALSSASFAAGNRSWDLQDRSYYNTDGVDHSAATTDGYVQNDEGFVVPGTSFGAMPDDGMTIQDRARERQYDKEHGDR